MSGHLEFPCHCLSPFLSLSSAQDVAFEELRCGLSNWTRRILMGMGRQNGRKTQTTVDFLGFVAVCEQDSEIQ